MAETIRNLKAAVKSDAAAFGDQISESYDTEIANLRSEIAALRELVAEKTSVAYDRVAEGASTAATYVQQEANSVASTIKEHPAATTTLLSLIGALGFAIGYVVATASSDSKQAWYQRYINDRF